MAGSGVVGRLRTKKKKKSKTAGDCAVSSATAAGDGSEMQREAPLTVPQEQHNDVQIPPSGGMSTSTTSTPDVTPASGEPLETTPHTSSEMHVESGSGSGSASGSTVDPRILITFSASGAMRFTNEVTRAFRQIFDRKWFPSGHAWKGLSEEQKRFYFEEFKKKFRWDPSFEGVMYDKFCKKGARQYSEVLYEIRTEHKVRPSLDQEILRAWEKVWNSPEFRRIREVNSKNKRTEFEPGAGMSTHCGGSRSYPDHKEALEKEKGAPVYAYTLFLHTHTKKNERGERVFSCAKAQAVVNEIEQELPTTANPDEAGTSQPVDPAEVNKAFYKAVKGKSKKQRVYGLADSAVQYYPEQYTSTATSSTSTFDEQRFQQYKEEVDAKMKAEIQQYHEKMEEERRRHDEEMMKRQQELISQQFAQLMASAPWSQWGPPPPSGSQQAIAPWGPPPASGSHQVGPSWGPPSAAPGTHQTSSSWGPPSSFGSQSGIRPAQGWWSGPAQGWWGPPQTAPHAPPSTSHAQVPPGGNLQQPRDGGSDTFDSLE